MVSIGTRIRSKIWRPNVCNVPMMVLLVFGGVVRCNISLLPYCRMDAKHATFINPTIMTGTNSIWGYWNWTMNRTIEIRNNPKVIRLRSMSIRVKSTEALIFVYTRSPRSIFCVLLLYQFSRHHLSLWRQRAVGSLRSLLWLVGSLLLELKLRTSPIVVHLRPCMLMQ